MPINQSCDNRATNLARELISRASVTPSDVGCQDLIASRLEPLGFRAEVMNFNDVRNLWIVRGDSQPLFVFAGHTDVVPPGDLAAWASNPFTPEIRDGMLFGRGTSDMKAAVASFVLAVEDFVSEHPDHPGSIALLLTSDEEGRAEDGTRRVVDVLKARGQRIDFCIVGEPSSNVVLGDAIRIGRRGSLTGYLTFHGKQGHVAYPEKVENPIHRAIPAIKSLIDADWDKTPDVLPDSCGGEHLGAAFFPPTSLQISSVSSDSGAANVVPQTAGVVFNFRFSPRVTALGLKQRVEEIVSQALSGHPRSSYEIKWNVGAEPFITVPGKLASAVRESLEQILGVSPLFSTAGGTSDGRFIAPIATELVELGLVNETIHQVNECVKVTDIELLKHVYQDILGRVILARISESNADNS